MESTPLVTWHAGQPKLHGCGMNPPVETHSKVSFGNPTVSHVSGMLPSKPSEDNVSSESLRKPVAHTSGRRLEDGAGSGKSGSDLLISAVLAISSFRSSWNPWCQAAGNSAPGINNVRDRDCSDGRMAALLPQLAGSVVCRSVDVMSSSSSNGSAPG